MKKLLLLVTFCAVLSAEVTWGSDVVPSLVTDPSNSQLTGVEGELFNVSCEGAGGQCSKFSEMKWTNSEGKEITAQRGQPKVVKTENQLFLVFTNPKLKDSGSYICSALYDGTQPLQRKVYIEIFAQERIRGRKPKFQSTVYNASVEQGLIVKFYCKAESKLPLTYEWFNKAGDKISRNQKKHIFVTNSSDDSSVLTIRGVNQKEDEGEYLCVAKNMNGLETKFYNLEVLSEQATGGLRMVTRPPGPHVRSLQGKPVDVSCETAGGERRKFSSPVWKTIDEEEIGDVVVAGSQVVLTVDNTNINDSTFFLCTAVYDNEVEIQYEVLVEFLGHKPEFQSYSQNIVADVGGWLRVPCQAQGELPINYTWYDQNAEQITEATNSTIYATQLDEQSFLTFEDVSAEDRGTYTCSARNTYGQVNKFYILRVLNTTGMKPEFSDSFENVTVKSGEQLALRCLAIGERPIKYDWYNQGEDKIPEDERSSVYAVSGTKYSELKFARLSAAHQGTYTCTASNDHGLVSKVFMLQVVE